MKKIRFAKIFLFFVLQEWLCVTGCFSEPPAFLDQESSHVPPILRRDTKIPVGVHDNTLHHITLPTGTPLHEIPFKISQKRTEVGLSPNIPFTQQNEFFQKLKWQTTLDILIKSPIPAKIIQIFVHLGKNVNQGDPLFTLECMKMEMLIRAPSPGETTHVFLEEGQFVNQDATLLALLPPSPPWEDINQAQILDNKDLLMALFPWAAITPPFTDNDPDLSPPSGEGNEVSPAISENESDSPLETSQLPSLPLEVTPVPQLLSIVPKFIPDNQSNAQSPQEEVRNLLEPFIHPLQKTEEILVPPSQNSVLTEQASPSLPVPQAIDDNESKGQNEDVIITSPLIEGNDVYNSLVDDKSSQVTETPQQAPSPLLSSEISLFPNNQSPSHLPQEEVRNLLNLPLKAIITPKIRLPSSQNNVLYHFRKTTHQTVLYVAGISTPPVEARNDDFGAVKDSKTLSKIENTVIVSPHRGRGNPYFRRPIIDSYFMEMASLPDSRASYTSQNWNELSLSPLNESYMLIPEIPLNFPVSLSKRIIPTNRPEMELEDTWAMSPSTGAKWLYGLIGISLLLLARKNKLKPSPFGYFHGVDCNKYPLITHYLADNLNFRESSKGNTLRVPHLRNPNTIERKKCGA